MLAAVKIDNATLTPRPSPTPFRCNVPFAEGQVQPNELGMLRLIDGSPCRFEQYGAAWPDGSVRFATLDGLITIGSAEKREIEIERGAQPMGDVGKSAPLPVSPHMPHLACQASTLGSPAELNLSGRTFDGQLVYELDLTIAPDGSHLYWDLTFTWSNPLVPDNMWVQPYDLTLAAPEGMFISCFDGMRRSVAGLLSDKTRNVAAVVSKLREMAAIGTVAAEKLILAPQGTLWGDGQSLAFRGAMLIEPSASAIAALEQPLWAIATEGTLRASQAFGPFGVVPLSPAWVSRQQNVDYCIRKILGQARAGGGLWYEPWWGLRKVPGSTGDQMDFGVTACLEATVFGEPLALAMYWSDVLQEACRPTHFYEADGTMERSANHPMRIFWDGRRHWSLVVCPDRGGKVPLSAPTFLASALPENWRDPAGALNPDVRTYSQAETDWIRKTMWGPSSVDFHGWWGKDNQHWSNNYLCSMALLTGNRQLLRLVQHEAEAFLSQENTSPPLGRGWATTEADAPRAVGRTGLAGSWIYLCTGRDDIKDRLQKRIDLSILPAWVGRLAIPPAPKPFETIPTDSRQFPVIEGTPAIFPWQEAICVTGLEAIYRVTGYQLARDMAMEIGRTVVDWGYQDRGNGAYQIFNCIKFANGNFGSPTDPLESQPADGTAFTMWGAGCAALVNFVYGNSSRGSSIWTHTRFAWQTPPSDLGIGRWDQWSGVVAL